MNYTIIGNGVAGTTAALAIREREPSANVVLIGDEHDYFFSRTALMYAYMDRMSLRDLEPFERKVYDRRRIQRLRRRVVGLNAETHTLTFADGSTFRFGKLLLATGSVPRKTQWPGLEKAGSGVVNFVSLQDLERCEALTDRETKAVVVGGGLIGVELVECLRHFGASVTHLVREPWYMAPKLNEAEGAMVANHLRHHGVDLRLRTEAGSVQADSKGRVSEVVTDSGEIFPCNFLGVAVGVVPAVEWLRELPSGPALEKGIVVDPAFRTSLPDVWAAGDCAEIRSPSSEPFVEQIWYSAKRQGKLAAASMLGDPVQYRPPIFFNSAKFFEIEYTVVGEMADDQTQEFCARLPGKDVTVRINNAPGYVSGFSFLGSRWNHETLTHWIEQRRSLDFVLQHIPEAQFDVEFGRKNLKNWQVLQSGVPA